MRFVSIVLLLGLIAGTVLYADKMDLIRLPELSWSPRPEGRVALPWALRQRPPEQQLTKALELAREGKTELALELYRTVVDTVDDPERQAEALFLWASALGQSMDQNARARQLFEQLTKAYPQSRFADNAHYSLGLLAVETGALRRAVYHFTYLIEHYPQSERLEEAKLMARHVSQRLVEGWRGVSHLSLPVSIVMNLLPNNLISLLALLTAVGGPLVWVLLGYLESPQRREVLKRSTIAKVMLLLFVMLIVSNYFLNRHQSQQDSQQLMMRLRQSGIDLAPPR